MKVLCCILLAMGISSAETGKPAPAAAVALLVSFRQHLALLPQSLPLCIWSRGLLVTICLGIGMCPYAAFAF